MLIHSIYTAFIYSILISFILLWKRRGNSVDFSRASKKGLTLIIGFIITILPLITETMSYSLAILINTIIVLILITRVKGQNEEKRRSASLIPRMIPRKEIVFFGIMIASWVGVTCYLLYMDHVSGKAIIPGLKGIALVIFLSIFMIKENIYSMKSLWAWFFLITILAGSFTLKQLGIISPSDSSTYQELRVVFPGLMFLATLLISIDYRVKKD